jgi:hypothetical protein
VLIQRRQQQSVIDSRTARSGANATVAQAGDAWTVHDVKGFGSTRYYKDTVTLVGAESSRPPGRYSALWHKPERKWSKIFGALFVGGLMGVPAVGLGGMRTLRDLLLPACVTLGLAGVSLASMALASPLPPAVSGSLWKDPDLLGGRLVFQPDDPSLPLVDLTEMATSSSPQATAGP